MRSCLHSETPAGENLNAAPDSLLAWRACGHSSPHPIVINNDAPRASSSVSRRGCLSVRSIPTSRITFTSSGCPRSPGYVPGDAAWTRVASAICDRNAAPICDRPALWTQAKSRAPSARTPPMGCDQGFSDSRQGGNEPLQPDRPGIAAAARATDTYPGTPRRTRITQSGNCVRTV